MQCNVMVTRQNCDPQLIPDAIFMVVDFLETHEFNGTSANFYCMEDRTNFKKLDGYLIRVKKEGHEEHCCALIYQEIQVELAPFFKTLFATNSINN